MDDLQAPETTRFLLGRILGQLQDIVGADLVGMYLHGSLAFGCFNPGESDVDFLVVVQERLAPAIKRRIVRAMIDLSPAAVRKGLEMSVVTRAALLDFQYPTPFEVHFSNDWIEHFEADEIDFETERTDPDLAAHLMVTRERGVRLFGLPIREVIPAVPRRAYLQSIANDAAEASIAIGADPVYGVLNLCRTLAFIRDGLITSKVEGGQWALTQLPAEFAPQVEVALSRYGGADPRRSFDEAGLHAFAEYAMDEIEGVFQDSPEL